MFKIGVFIGIIISVLSCKKHNSRDNSEEIPSVDSAKLVYQSAFTICSLDVEKNYFLTSAVFAEHIYHDSLLADSLNRKVTELDLEYSKSVNNFTELTQFGTKNEWHIQSYCNFIRIQYLENRLPKPYFAYHKKKILEIANEINSSVSKYTNPFDSTQSFHLNDKVFKILKLVGVDSSLINFESLKNVNILVESTRNPPPFPYFIQNREYNCGPACLKAIADYNNMYFSLSHIEKLAGTDTSGTTFKQLEKAAEKMGFKADHQVVDLSLLVGMHLPIVVHWNYNHFVIVYEFNEDLVKVSDPEVGLLAFTYENFLAHWLYKDGDQNSYGNVLEIELK